MSAPRPRYLKTAAVASAILAAAIVAGCGKSNANDPAGQPGKQLFTEKCGSCHVLAAAGTKGVTGPNLDASFQDSLDVGFKRSTIESVTLKQISLPMGKVMPANLVKGKEAEAVAAYVADSIGKAPPAGEDTGGAKGTGKANAQNVIDNPPDPTGQLSYKYKSLEAKAGKVTLEATNESTVPHNIAIEGGDKGAVVAGGKTSKITPTLKAGKYTFLCTVPGHAQAGMKGTLTVN